ncbi:hypothetical protein M011DRAFT_377348, partial [Sporormia fimetaria CBS 119925]
RLSHQASSDLHQDTLKPDQQWFDADGTPLFYSAWSARPSRLSPEPGMRSQVLDHGSRVACWPSSGGVYIKYADVVDMLFLDLDRFHDTPRQFNQTAEDAFC